MPNTTKSFYQRAALFSLYAPLVCWLLAILNNNVIGPSLEPANAQVGRNIVGGITMLLVPTGCILGIIALVGMKNVGTQGILERAVVGVVLSGLIIVSILPLLPKILKEGFH